MLDVLVGSLLAGDKRALARILTLVETGGDTAKQVSKLIYPHTGHSQVIGITGAPGTGKSTLVSELTKTIRAEDTPVAILAIDPSSPYTGGAFMGDRVRMLAHTGDEGVFIRSMATRGKLGGLANATRDAIRVLDAAGFPLILLETVGTGQSEVEVAKMADTTVVVEAPGLGDDVQAIKAGLLEIADVLVVNKADRPGAAQTAKSLQQMLELGRPTARNEWVAHHRQAVELPVMYPGEDGMDAHWSTPIVKTVATHGEGIDQLWVAIQQHFDFYQQPKKLPAWRRFQLSNELRERTVAGIMEAVWNQVDELILDDVLEQLQSREIDPYLAVEFILSTAKMHVVEDWPRFK